jgi:hypothetical protein
MVSISDNEGDLSNPPTTTISIDTPPITEPTPAGTTVSIAALQPSGSLVSGPSTTLRPSGSFHVDESLPNPWSQRRTYNFSL